MTDALAFLAASARSLAALARDGADRARAEGLTGRATQFASQARAAEQVARDLLAERASPVVCAEKSTRNNEERERCRGAVLAAEGTLPLAESLPSPEEEDPERCGGGPEWYDGITAMAGPDADFYVPCPHLGPAVFRVLCRGDSRECRPDARAFVRLLERQDGWPEWADVTESVAIDVGSALARERELRKAERARLAALTSAHREYEAEAKEKHRVGRVVATEIRATAAADPLHLGGSGFVEESVPVLEDGEIRLPLGRRLDCLDALWKRKFIGEEEYRAGLRWRSDFELSGYGDGAPVREISPVIGSGGGMKFHEPQLGAWHRRERIITDYAWMGGRHSLPAKALWFVVGASEPLDQWAGRNSVSIEPLGKGGVSDAVEALIHGIALLTARDFAMNVLPFDAKGWTADIVPAQGVRLPDLGRMVLARRGIPRGAYRLAYDWHRRSGAKWALTNGRRRIAAPTFAELGDAAVNLARRDDA